MQPRIAVTASCSTTVKSAEQLAKQLQLPLLAVETEASAYDFILLVTTAHLALQDRQHPQTKPLYIDFLAGKNAWRQQAGGKELLAKAVGYKPHHKPSVIDATAGLGRDAFVLASLGCRVLMLERSPLIGALLQDALIRLRMAKEMPQLQLIQQNAADYFNQLSETHQPEVIYLDPMYPHRSKTALVKKEMRILRALVGDDDDASAIAQTALTIATKRVVIKRPRLAAPLIAKPDIHFSGNHSRFDVYLLS